MASPTPNLDDVPALEMRGVTVASLHDPGQTVLEGVNWTVAAREFWVVVGLLRSGKSALMAVAAGTSPPAAGTCQIFGREVTAGFEREQLALRLRLGVVFDGGHLIHHLTLAENIALPLRYHYHHTDSETEDHLKALLALTGLERWADSLPARVNRNWQQRIGLARALALRPEVLLLDSPLTGLDPRDAIWWLETIQALAAGHPLMAKRPLTVIVTGDDLRPWKSEGRRFAVLKNRQFVPLAPGSEPGHDPDAVLREGLPAPAPPTNLKR